MPTDSVSLESRSSFGTSTARFEGLDNSRWMSSSGEWFRTHVKDQEQFEEKLIGHRTRLINTASIASHFSQSTLIQLCSLSNSEAVRLLVYHVSHNHTGLKAAFEEYCEANADLRACLIGYNMQQKAASHLLHRLPQGAERLSRVAVWRVPILPSRSLLHLSGPISMLTGRQEDCQKGVTHSSLLKSVPSSSSSLSTFCNSGRVTYASAKEAIVIIAPTTTLGAVHPNETVEILVVLKEQCLPSEATDILFCLVGTCLICQFQTRRHVHFSTKSGETYPDSSIFSLGAPAKSRCGRASEEIGTYSLLANIRMSDQAKCHCQQPDIQLNDEALPKPTNSGTMQHCLTITGTPIPLSYALLKDTKTYSATMPLTTCQITRSKMLSRNFPVSINGKDMSLKILFSWKLQLQCHTVHYILTLSVCDKNDNMDQKLKLIGRGIQVTLLWKTRAGEDSRIKIKTLQVGRHDETISMMDGRSSETQLRIKGTIGLPSSSKMPISLAPGLKSSWYELEVKSPLAPSNGILFSASLKS
ncbi:hypothetical protein CROQUDRAFT_653221 [Cronartium quercuum f. sp. fusiforme G11]|uniref:Uncharacterized protein n=1 Tax=Cronartium quercuum f. sp. fusiforme G11 TaxID=708437 RepID=A0A9P6NQP4_9BASI|nr:hypothetical protein CROQUDRAFT_653221 [Cronartium quercuum f. sp. fusiforme G11]